MVTVESVNIFVFGKLVIVEDCHIAENVITVPLPVPIQFTGERENE